MKTNTMNCYLDFYGLSDYPFNNTPDPRFFYPSKTHSAALSSLEYGISTKKGLMTIIGDSGIGKSAFLHALMSRFGKNIKTLFLEEAQYINFKSLSAFILNNFEIHDQGLDEFTILQKIKDLLIYEAQKDSNVVLLIDEAQYLNKEALRTIGFLSNLETSREKLLQIILAGQTGLKIELNRPEMQHIKQRIYFECHLSALTEDEIYEYIDYRFQNSGSKLENIFNKEAFYKICSLSKGIPRLINSICDKALLAGCSQEKKIIDEIIITRSSPSYSHSATPSPLPFPRINSPRSFKESEPEGSSPSKVPVEREKDEVEPVKQRESLCERKKNPGKLYINKADVVNKNNYTQIKNIDYNFLNPRLVDEYQKTKSNLDFFSDSKIQSICIASANHGEGTSTIASNFATALVIMEENATILIDANFRSPILHKFFDVDQGPGLADIAMDGRDWRDIIKKTKVSNLSLITSGRQFSPASNEPSFIFHSDYLKQMIKELKNEFEYIIFDGAPINYYSDTTILANQLEGLILAIQAGKTRREIIQNARFILDNADIKIIGAILNRRKYYIPNWIYKKL